MHAKTTRTFFWFPAFYFYRKIERNRVPNLGPKVSNRIFTMTDQVAKEHFKFKRKLRLPEFKFKQGIKKFSSDASLRDLYISINILWIFLWWIVNEESLSSNVSKLEEYSSYTSLKAL